MDRGESHAPVDDSESLVSLAARKALPEHQYIDWATVAWIQGNRSEIPRAERQVMPSLSDSVRRILLSAPIPLDWHAEPLLADTIHGTRHLLRTAVFAAILADENGLEEELIEALVVAGALHDCRRLHDKDDFGHGSRGADWFISHVDEIAEYFDLRCSPRHLAKAAIAIALHEVPYAAFTEEHHFAWRSAGPLVDLLKTADALDRYRLPKLKWWPREDLLAHRAPPWLHRLAFFLVIDSESRFLRGVTGAEAVRASLTVRGLL
ncbi:HD domain-containing protein [Saccharopolyspora hattusasensis]|uniref:HD domain-containing protein n=1 Tax=Saccharopolyspora hattusasensis TaxID=1128679 RepID=UPI003D99E3E4